MIRLILAILLLIPSVAWCAPSSITATWSDTLDNGDELVVSGSGFIAGGGPHVVIYDNWDDGGTNNTANDLDATDGGGIGAWSSTGKAGGLLYYTGDYVSGNRSAKIMDDTATNINTQWRQNILSFPDSYEWFMSWYWKLPSNKAMESSDGNGCMGVQSCGTSAWQATISPCCAISTTLGNYKFYYLGDDKSGDDFWNDDNVIDSFTGNYNNRIWGNSVNVPSMYTWDYEVGDNNDWLNSGDWIRFDDYLKGDPDNSKITTSSGVIYTRRANQNTSVVNNPIWSQTSTGQITSSPTKSTLPERWNKFSFLGYMIKYTPNATQLVDNFYFAAGDNAYARVELCNASDYDSANKCFISPTTSWSNTEIRVKAQQGNLSTTPFYIHVFDKNRGHGVSSSSYTFGSTGTPPPDDTTAPSVTSISSSSPDGTYGIGDPINITVNIDEIGTFSNLIVTLDSGGSCTINESNTNSGSCTYTVAAEQNSSDLSVSTLVGSISDSVPNTNSSPTIPSGKNLDDSRAIVVDTTGGTDTTPPVVSNPQPSGVIAWDADVSLSVNTDEPAICKYDLDTGISYSSMQFSFASDDNVFHHSTMPESAEAGQSYHYYGLCQDTSGNTSDEFEISFSLSDTIPVKISNVGLSRLYVNPGTVYAPSIPDPETVQTLIGDDTSYSGATQNINPNMVGLFKRRETGYTVLAEGTVTKCYVKIASNTSYGSKFCIFAGPGGSTDKAIIECSTANTFTTNGLNEYTMAGTTVFSAGDVGVTKYNLGIHAENYIPVSRQSSGTNDWEFDSIDQTFPTTATFGYTSQALDRGYATAYCTNEE